MLRAVRGTYQPEPLLTHFDVVDNRDFHPNRLLARTGRHVDGTELCPDRSPMLAQPISAPSASEDVRPSTVSCGSILLPTPSMPYTSWFNKRNL